MPTLIGEWSTYSLADFLMFAPRTYYRLFELYNREIWPAQLLAVVLGLAIPALLRWGGPWRLRAVGAILVLSWAWIAWGFHWRYYSTINWPATWFAVGFALQALLIGAILARLHVPRGNHPADAIGYGLLGFALVVQPWIGPLLGRPLAQVELFGTAPDPTAVATLGVLVLLAGRVSWLLWPMPLLWCAISGATLWTMEASDPFLLPLAGMLSLAAAIWRRKSHGR